MDPDSEPARPSGFRTIFVCDIVGFGERAGRDRVQEHLHLALYKTLRAAFGASGIGFDDCYYEDRGDGVVVVLPAETDAALLVFPLFDHLRAEVRRANELASDAASMRLRVALHCGRMESDSEGIVGTTVNHVFRLLDAPGFKQAMRESTADVGVLASTEFHAAVIQDGRGAIDPGEFRPIDVHVKETRTTAWIRVPGTDATPPADDKQAGDKQAGEEQAGEEQAGEEVVPTPPPPVGQEFPPGRVDGDEAPLPTAFELVELILAIPVMTSPEGRDHVVSALRQEIAIRIQRSARPNLDMLSIIRTCLDFPGGVEELLAIVRAFAGDSSQMRALDAAIARIMRHRD